MRVRDDFRAPDLDLTVWYPYYLPHWSSRAATAAVYELGDDGLHLRIPTDHGRWCPDTHATPLRVSGVATGEYAGSVGKADGAQPFSADLEVREAQPRFEGWLSTGGHVEIRCNMSLSHRSMAALWLAGFEDEPHRSGEICVFEIFGKDVDEHRSAAIGVGHKQLNDPELAHDFDAVRVDIDVEALHTYAVDYDSEHSVFTVDGCEIKRCSNPPQYPMQLMLAVFDFPDWSDGGDDHLVPRLTVDLIAGDRRDPPGRDSTMPATSPGPRTSAFGSE